MLKIKIEQYLLGIKTINYDKDFFKSIKIINKQAFLNEFDILVNKLIDKYK